ncbi:MAG: ATP-binding cassette domain-containing protein [Corallococcus sp.]|nr:ATP-binding cassette domain-containing protein [Bacillota bacterium]MCM1533639.1 ATP-binding cassette domain-containing protein [Corallococcus sp.]
MIKFENVSLRYPYDEFALFKNLTFTLQKGENTVLCDTQSGKTSLCKLLVGEVSPTGGKIFFDNEEISRIAHSELGILYLSDNSPFFENKSILYNVGYPLKVRKVNVAERKAIIDEAVLRTGLDNLERKVKTLDSNTRKTVALCRGLTVKRQVVLYDDFFDNTDGIERTLGLFGDVTSVIITSNTELARGNTVVLDGGNTVYCGDAENARAVVENLCWLYGTASTS